MLVGRSHVRGSRSQRTRRARIGAAIVVAMLVAASAAQADGGDATRAHEAYDRGTAAFQRGEFAVAAREFAAADALSPSTVALHAALDAAVRADDPVLGVELLDRVARVPSDAALDATARDARAKFAGRTGRVSVVCAATPCHATIDGVAVDGGARVIVRVGPHAASIESDGHVVQRTLDVPPDATIVLSPSTSTTPTHGPPSYSGGISPTWFFIGLGATAIAGGLGIASGIDTSNKHASFVSAGCDHGGGGNCATLANDGSSAQTRTNVILGVTGALALTTAAIAIFAVRWRYDVGVSAGLVHGAPSASLRLAF